MHKKHVDNVVAVWITSCRDAIRSLAFQAAHPRGVHRLVRRDRSVQTKKKHKGRTKKERLPWQPHSRLLTPGSIVCIDWVGIFRSNNLTPGYGHCRQSGEIQV